MRPRYAVGVMTLILVILIPAVAAMAQLHPGRGVRGGYGGYGGYYGGYGEDAGVWGAYTSALSNATTRYIAESDKLAGQNAALQQRAMMQSGIRNTLTTQAETRTQDLYNQRQSNRDWWFQVQQQQVAQRQATAARPSMGVASVAGFESAMPAASQPEAAANIIKWPPVLCEARFAEQRARVEAPYRRNPEKQANPTVEDYKNMIDAAGRMKTILGEMTAEISAQEYFNTEKYLDQLAAEARGRIEKARSGRLHVQRRRA
jgi:hypothetical protein